jgi:hypothetical protein
VVLAIQKCIWLLSLDVDLSWKYQSLVLTSAAWSCVPIDQISCSEISEIVAQIDVRNRHHDRVIMDREPENESITHTARAMELKKYFCVERRA